MTNEETTKTEEVYFVASVTARIGHQVYWIGRETYGLPDDPNCIHFLADGKETAYRFKTKQEPFLAAEGWSEMTFQYGIEPKSIRVYRITEKATIERTEQEVARLPHATVSMTTANQKVTPNG